MSKGFLFVRARLTGRTRVACVFDEGNLTSLPGLGGTFSGALAISDTGDIVGSASIAGDLVSRATLWRNNIVHDLGTGSGWELQGASALTELADHIEQTHHQYLRDEFPRLDKMTARVAPVHGDKEPRLLQIREAFVGLAAGLTSHMLKEEQILFPMSRQLEAGDSTAASNCGSIANPIQQMEAEHDQAGSALETLRELTGGYSPPDWACNTYRAMFDGLAQLERDLHVHIHKENIVLFPRAIELAGTSRA